MTTFKKLIYNFKAHLDCLNPNGFKLEESLVNVDNISALIISTPYELVLAELNETKYIYGLITLNDNDIPTVIGHYIRNNDDFIAIESLTDFSDPLGQGYHIIDTRIANKEKQLTYVVDVQNDIQSFAKLEGSKIRDKLRRAI